MAFLNCIKKSTKKNKKLLHSHKLYVILTLAVTLIAMKREVATKYLVGFPWSECQVKKLTASHCTNNHPESGDDVCKVVKCFNL